MRRVLLIARNFAPASHVSAERATKLAKYLPEFGWQPTVLTGARATVGLPVDESLLDQVAGIEVIRTAAPEFSFLYNSRPGSRDTASIRGAPRRGSLHPKSWLIPDSQVLWYPFAVRAAMRAGRPARWDAILATCFPPTAILVAHTVARRLRVPYVIDFRDSWTAFHHAPHRPSKLAEVERRLERRMVRDAAAVVAVDRRIVQHAYAGIPTDDRPPLHEIQNGYDEDDFQGVRPAALPRYSIVHTGQLRRSPAMLWEALDHTLRERPEMRGNLHLWQVGFVAGEAARGLREAPDGVTVHHVPPVSQREAIGFMLGADLLLVDEYGSIMPSKTLQYLRASRPILAMLEKGGVIRQVLEPMPQAHLVTRSEAAQAGRLIAELTDRPRGLAGEPSGQVTAFSRREIARRFAAVLDAVAEGRRRGSGERLAMGLSLT